MTGKAEPSVTALDRALARVIECNGELGLLRSRLAGAREDLDDITAEVREASLRVARSGSDIDHAAEGDALSRQARVERRVSNLANILIPEAEARAELAEAEAEQARRTAVTDEAEELCASLAARFEEEYPRLIAGLAALKADVATADAKSGRANASLPDGRAPVLPVEHRVRDIPHSPGGIVSQEPVMVWCYAGTNNPVPPNRVDQIFQARRPYGGGEGSYHLPSRSAQAALGGQRVEQRQLLRVVIEERSHGQRGPRINDMILPPLRSNAIPDARRVELRDLPKEAQGKHW